MNEIDILLLFYNEMRTLGISREQVFLSINENAVAIFSQKYGNSVTLDEVEALTDVCIANEWLERTTIDPGYNFLSLTAQGLQIILAHEYARKKI